MKIKHRNASPKVDESALVTPTSVVVGNVTIGSRSRIMYGAVINSEGSKVNIGECTIICENAVIRAVSSPASEQPVDIGDNVFIGPHATLLGCKVEDKVYIATGATVLQGATIHSGAVITVGALVHSNAVIPEGFFVPPYTVAIGNPVKLFSPNEREAMGLAIKEIGFAKTAFGIAEKLNNSASLYKQTTEIRSKEFKIHLDDEIID
jgi:carbonic anhydrase/acetyltransferase-like protein (isoleucine patch superfamily)